MLIHNQLLNTKDFLELKEKCQIQYDKNGHRYHSWNHAKKVANYVQEICTVMLPDISEDSFLALMVAAYCHDVVNVPGAKDNEVLSFEWYMHKCFSFALSNNIVSDNVYAYILETQHKGYPNNYLSAVIRDADMAVLGSHWQDYIQYSFNVKSEYDKAGYSSLDWLVGRTAFLKSCLAKQIFYTPYADRRWHANAVRNISNEFRSLSFLKQVNV